jgi:hypothetical protein
MTRGLDVRKAAAALKQAAYKATHGSREERSGRLVSSVIHSIEYDEDSRELDVTFNSGKTYRYIDVPQDVYADFLDAASKGQYFNNHIKDAFAVAELRSKG